MLTFEERGGEVRECRWFYALVGLAVVRVRQEKDWKSACVVIMCITALEKWIVIALQFAVRIGLVVVVVVGLALMLRCWYKKSREAVGEAAGEAEEEAEEEAAEEEEAEPVAAEEEAAEPEAEGPEAAEEEAAPALPLEQVGVGAGGDGNDAIFVRRVSTRVKTSAEIINIAEMQGWRVNGFQQGRNN